MKALVVYNGPSGCQYQGRLKADLVIGCNWAYRHWPVTDLVAIDRFTVSALRGDAALPSVRLWTRRGPLELPPGWRDLAAPGIDSGSLAVSVALELGADTVTVIGADGVLGVDHSNIYHYPWHPQQPKRHIHTRHRRTLVELSRQHWGRIIVNSGKADPDLITATDQNILEEFKIS